MFMAMDRLFCHEAKSKQVDTVKKIRNLVNTRFIPNYHGEIVVNLELIL